MKTLRWTLGGLCWLVALAAGLYLLVAAAWPMHRRLDGWIARRPEAAAPVGILVAGLAVLAAMSLRTRPAGAEELRYPTDGGEVRIRLGAVRDYVVQLAGELPGVQTVRCAATREGDRVRIELHCRLPVGRSAVEFGRRLQALIRSRLADDVGLSETGDICVRVTEFVTGGGSAGGDIAYANGEPPRPG
ncbi:MAG: alkaline shock response membrane anchor protein AmaP [Kiritimatiellae bacterium]|nr:alkaline shock response membrane anchor protein AmaP [Kiritimatiellia bacterium]